MTKRIKPEPPYTLTMELTHRCPLRCPYCSNPTELTQRDDELPAEKWLSIIDQAADISIVQANLTGGEPLAYEGLSYLIRRLRQRDIYSNLITSGIGLSETRLAELIDCGLESIQISLQSADPATAALIAGWDAYEEKLKAVKIAVDSKIPVSLNVVLHRHNLAEVGTIIDMAHGLKIKRLELANTQFYGFALANIENLIPSEVMMNEALAVYESKKAELSGKMQMSWVIGDYLESSPKPCMGGWARQHLVISVDGTAYPCLAAKAIKTLPFPSTKEHSLKWIWEESEAFNAFRGYDWMVEPCRTCEFKEVDFGGCRCQAFLITGDARQADPVCKLSPHHKLVEDRVKNSSQNELGSAKDTGSFLYRLN